jgi:hypothetical protein
MVCERWLAVIALGYSPVADFCGQGNVFLDFIEGEEFLH